MRHRKDNSEWGKRMEKELTAIERREAQRQRTPRNTASLTRPFRLPRRIPETEPRHGVNEENNNDQDLNSQQETHLGVEWVSRQEFLVPEIRYNE